MVQVKNGKNSRNLVVVLAGEFIICLLSMPGWAQYGGGSGIEGDPFLISDPNHMQAIGADPNNWDKHFLLTADIDLSAYSGTSFNIIGSKFYDKSFTGVFDGNGHVIRNLTYTTTEAKDRVGLFGGAFGATIKNIGIEDVNISSAGYFVGGLVGWNWGSIIERCYVQGNISGADYVGLLIGCNDWVWYSQTGLIRRCFAWGYVTGI